MNLARCWCAAICLAPGFFADATAQEYPSRLIRIIVAFPPGGSTDIYARVIANELQVAWGRSVIVENRPGGTGVIGTQAVRQSSPDGYTLLFTSNTGHVLGPLLQNPRPFDAVADFTPISKALRFPLYLIVHPSIPARSLAEFIAFAKAKPGQLNFASSGQGGTSHLVAELFDAAAGIKATHVPYKGAAPALQAVLTGEQAVETLPLAWATTGSDSRMRDFLDASITYLKATGRLAEYQKKQSIGLLYDTPRLHPAE